MLCKITGCLSRLSILLGVLICLVPIMETGASDIPSPERVRVRSVIGKAEVVSPSGDDVKPLRVGMGIHIGWNVRTGAESRVDLVFESGTVLCIGENSVVTLSNTVENTQNSPISAKRKDTL